MKRIVRLNARLMPVIVLLAAVMQVIDPSRVWVILLVGLGGAWLVCRWWAYRLARSLQFEREMRFGWAQVGDRLEERFTLSNHCSLPAPWVTVQDHSTLPDHHASVATGVDASSTSQWTIKTQCTRRGVYTLGGTTLEAGDPLGMYSVTLEDTASTTLVVMPPVVSLPALAIAASGWAGEGAPRRHALEETINVSQTREMQPPDPLRLVHWKTTARQGKFFVRQFEGAPAAEWWILLDLDQECQLGTGWDSTEEHAVILAASLAARGLNDEHPVGLSINGTPQEWVTPQRNEYQLRRLLKSLALAGPSQVSLQNYLERAGQSLSGHCSLIIVTANAQGDWAESLLPLIWRGVVPTVFLLDPQSFGGQASTNVLAGIFQSMGIPQHIVGREFIDHSQARPGHEGEWQWRTYGTGRAVPVRAPQEDWRSLDNGPSSA